MGAPEAKASGIIMDGALKALPGFETGAYKLDQIPFMISSGAIDLTTAGANLSPFLVPFNATIVYAGINVIAAPGTAAATFVVGTRADADHFIDDYSVGTAHATGLTDITDEATVVNTSVDEGDIIEFSTDGGGTTTGTAVGVLILVPRI